jgi:hypothetical protein
MITLGVTPLTLGCSWIIDWFSQRLGINHRRMIGGGVAVVLFAVFVAARVFILVEAVRSLAYQPPETFRTTWAANIPHVG